MYNLLSILGQGFVIPQDEDIPNELIFGKGI